MFRRGVFTFLGVLLIAGPAWAVDPADKCEAAKLKEAGKYGFCRLKAESKYAKTGDATKYADALAKCDEKYSEKWGKAETKAEGACATSGDEGDMKAEITNHADLVAALLHDPNYQAPVVGCGDGIADPNANEECDFGDLGGGTCQTQGFAYGTLACGPGCAFDTSGCTDTRFVDPNDGTIIDNQTGLMWEKKTDDASVHDVDNVYSWSATFEDPDGTAFVDFLGELNNCVDDGTYPPTGVTGGFAGYCDWRLPTIVELQAILLEPYPCDTDPCIDPIFGPTASSYYWSSSTFATGPVFAWDVYFFNGNVRGDYKDLDRLVRAVRGGL